MRCRRLTYTFSSSDQLWAHGISTKKPEILQELDLGQNVTDVSAKGRVQQIPSTLAALTAVHRMLGFLKVWIANPIDDRWSVWQMSHVPADIQRLQSSGRTLGLVNEP